MGYYRTSHQECPLPGGKFDDVYGEAGTVVYQWDHEAGTVNGQCDGIECEIGMNENMLEMGFQGKF